MHVDIMLIAQEPYSAYVLCACVECAAAAAGAPLPMNVAAPPGSHHWWPGTPGGMPQQMGSIPGQPHIQQQQYPTQLQLPGRPTGYPSVGVPGIRPPNPQAQPVGIHGFTQSHAPGW